MSSLRPPTGRALADVLRRGVGPTPSEVALGDVTAVSVDDDFGVELEVAFGAASPRDTCTARPAFLGASGGRGVFTRFSVGDEVILLFPGGNRNAAVALGVMPASREQRAREGWNGETFEVSSLPAYFRPTPFTQSDRVVLRNMLVDLATTIQALSGLCTALDTAFTPPASVTAAALSTKLNTSRLSLALIKAELDSFKANLDADVQGAGGPYVTNAILGSHGSR